MYNQISVLMCVLNKLKLTYTTALTTKVYGLTAFCKFPARARDSLNFTDFVNIMTEAS